MRMIYGNPDRPFFEDNREMRWVSEVRALIDVYGMDKAGKYMWAIWLVHHPASTIFEMGMDDKIEWIKSNYLNDPDFEWPGKVIKVIQRKPAGKPGRKKKPSDEDDEDEDDSISRDKEMNDALLEVGLRIGFKDKDLLFEETGVHEEFLRVIDVFPQIAMGIEERYYYGLVRLRDLAMMRAEYLNGKDMAAAIRQIAGANSDLDKMKSQYLTWKDNNTRASGDVQSGWASSKGKK